MTNGSGQGRRGPGLLRKVVYSLLPVTLILGTAEAVVRGLDLARPSLHSLPLPMETFGVVRSDPDLFWAPVPRIHTTTLVPETGETIAITTNSLGTRGPEIGPKTADEYRILSLGESTTFGAKVSDDETYSARLESLLDARGDRRRYTVINAGVGAWSSFQSLTYLKLRGLALKPDMVLFYHEYNDYLPSSLRGGDNTEIGLSMTDRELYRSRTGIVGRTLMAHSALAQLLGLEVARLRFEHFQESRDGEPPVAIGLQEIGALPQVADADDAPAEIRHDALPRRVSPRERLEILEELAALCEANGIALVIIHPSYAQTRPHECLLTRFCAEHGVTMLEAQEVLHRRGIPVERMFIDVAHPTAYGHDQLARALVPVVQRLARRGPGAREPASS